MIGDETAVLINGSSTTASSPSSSTDDPKTNDKDPENMKEQANRHFKDGQYERAIELYSKAIELNPSSAVYFANRSFAYIKTECYGYALNDANKAIELDPYYIKAYYRRAAANMALGKFKLALRDYEIVKKSASSDVDAQKKYQECSKIVKRMAFEMAIAVQGVEKSVAELIDLDSMAIEDEYKGPSLVDGKVTLEFCTELVETFRNQQRLHRKYAYKILLDIKKYFMQQPSLVEITVPPGKKFTICGDIHGQFYDLLNVFKLNGIPSEENPYLFNGDFVDRGSFSVETIFLLFSFKLLYPNHFFMSRGNHESQIMNQMYGFQGEVKSKYSGQMAELFTEVYNWLPLCHMINEKILVMHGGLFATDDVSIDDLRKIDRNRQPPEDGPMCDLLWSDPQPQNGRSSSKRGVGTLFGPDVTQRFCSKFGFQYIVRSHEVKPDGYEVAHNGQCITVFSAPNYCDVMGNKGAFLVINGSDLTPKFTTYEAVPHPNVRAMAYADSIFGMA